MIFFAICPYQPQLNGPIIQNISRTAELEQVDAGAQEPVKSVKSVAQGID